MMTIYYETLLCVNFSYDFVDEKAPEATAGPAHPAPVKPGLGSQSETPRQKPTTSSGLPGLELDRLPADTEEIDEGRQMRKHNDSHPVQFKFINFLFTISTSSESEGKVGHNISTQFDDVAQESDDDEHVNVDMELALERSLQCHLPPKEKTQEQVVYLM